MKRPPLAAWPLPAWSKLTLPPGASFWSTLRARLNAPVGGARPAGSLAVFEVGELPELQQMFGPAAARHVVARILRVLAALDPVRGRVLRTTPTTFAVLLPADDARQAQARVRRALGRSLAIDSDWRGEEIVIVPDFRVRAFEGAAGSRRAVYQQMRSEIAAAQRYEQQRNGYLRREGESRCAAALARRRAGTGTPAAPC